MVQALAFAELVLGGLFIASALSGEPVGQLLTQGITASGKEKAHGAGVGAEPSGTPIPGHPNQFHEKGLTPGALDGILPKGAKYILNRKDQGRDVQLTPGQALLASGNYEVVGIGNDPKGFGPAYPILHMFTGPWAGQDVYYGHTDIVERLPVGSKGFAGDIVAHTSKTGHNAPPGWLEFGFAPQTVPGPLGQKTPF